MGRQMQKTARALTGLYVSHSLFGKMPLFPGRRAEWTKDDPDCSRLRCRTSKQCVSTRHCDSGGKMSVIGHPEFPDIFFREILPTVIGVPRSQVVLSQP
jgi:hypothetical protein